MIPLIIQHIKVLKQNYSKINSFRDTLYFILTHFDLKYLVNYSFFGNCISIFLSIDLSYCSVHKNIDINYQKINNLRDILYFMSKYVNLSYLKKYLTEFW